MPRPAILSPLLREQRCWLPADPQLLINFVGTGRRYAAHCRPLSDVVLSKKANAKHSQRFAIGFV
jgi:hypothetical protein